MTRLSVNVNKIALIRNARGENQPDLGQVSLDCEAFGAQGITVHPRPDERHIRYDDIPMLKSIVRTEFNVEGNPSERFMELVLAHRPTQVTLVPDDPGVLTSSEGWDTRKNEAFLRRITEQLQKAGIRVSIFLDPDTDMVDGAQQIGADRIELYTGDYARQYAHDPERAITDHRKAAERAQELGVGLNAGHDLNLDNLAYYAKQIPGLLEVSIGHALVCDALYYGLKNTIQMYLRQLQ
jgi:pyridoxine 5-phosphate synthase